MTFYKKSGKRVIESVLNRQGSIGLVGSDVVGEYYEDDPRIKVDELEPVRNENGDELRFAVLAPDNELTSDRYVTSYPNTARRVLGTNINLTIAGSEKVLTAALEAL